MQRVTDAVNKSRNVSHVPKRIAALYGPYQNAVGTLTDELGRQPTDEEVLPLMPKGKTKITVDTLKRLRQGTRRELFSGIGDDQIEPSKAMGVRDAYALLRPTFSPQERQFVELHYPEEEAGPSKSIKEISKAMGLPPHTVYRLKSSVESRLTGVIKKT
jgi:DNA-directed RNA polymerase specialized sigma subunit